MVGLTSFSHFTIATRSVLACSLESPNVPALVPVTSSHTPSNNRIKPTAHGVRFSDSEGALVDPLAVTREDEGAKLEARFITIGADFTGRIVVVVYTHRGDDIRLISARRATRGERRQYEEGV